jgi:hypothetical protein
MGAGVNKQNLTTSSSIHAGVAMFFRDHTPDSAKVMFWKLFQCWAIKECTLKAEVSDEEVALFFDQLNDLVSAAYLLPLTSRREAVMFDFPVQSWALLISPAE